MKIVQVIGEFTAAGAEQLVFQLTLALRRQGHELEVWRFYDQQLISPRNDATNLIEREMQQLLEREGVQVRCLHKVPHKNYVSTWRTLRAWTRAFSPDVIHAHLEEVSFHTAIATIGLSVPMVQTLHLENIRRPILYRTIFNWCYDKLPAVSQNVFDAALQKIPKLNGKLTVVPNGILLERYHVERTQAESVKQIISIGRLHPAKNHALMIRLMAQLKRACLAKHRSCPVLTIYGEGPLRQTLTAQILEADVGDVVHLPGITDEIPRVLKESDLYLCTSQVEGMSIALLEAMAAGLPILSTEVAGVSDLLEDGKTAVIIPQGNEEQLFQALESLCFDPVLRHQLSDSVEAAVQPFGVDCCAKQYVHVYESI